MAEMAGSEGGTNRHHKGKRRSKKMSVRVDLTPMVDLAFLLITFFMLTTQLQHSKALEMQMPISNGPPPAPVGECRIMNVVVDSFDRVYTYEGLDIANMKLTPLNHADDLRQIMVEKAGKVKQGCGVDKDGKPHTMITLVKMMPGARYKNLVDIVDELVITGNPGFSMQDAIPDEIEAVRKETGRLLAQGNP